MLSHNTQGGDMILPESASVECVAECPHFEPVKGSCGHDLEQEVINYFIDNPGCQCPIYGEWRARQMATLAKKLEQK